MAPAAGFSAASECGLESRDEMASLTSGDTFVQLLRAMSAVGDGEAVPGYWLVLQGRRGNGVGGLSCCRIWKQAL